MAKNYILLISENKENINEILNLFKNNKSINFYVCSNKDELFNKNRIKIDFVIIDSDSISYNYFKLIKKIKKINNKIGILILAENIDDSLKAYISKYNSISISSLKKSKDEIKYNTLNYFISLRSARLNIEVSKFLTLEKKIYRLPNSLKYVGPISEQLTRNLVEIGIVDKDYIYNIKFGIQEMLINAIEHGNLEITYEQKSELLKQGFDINKIIEKYALKEEFKKRKVIIKYYLTKNKVIYVIKDQGKGFDWRKIPNCIDGANSLLEHGRGIIMTKNYFDEFYYNEKGNQVTMVIYRKK
ncbi:MAG TPA: ATP-binding protein [Spirochaetota bacterium]|nr:ATP-binding protein [Spirochaetota bacterium]HOL57221.1 ATP-binding protein [Spirochaetota bacterium]HPP04856.1 ATP-binding protein [Spirochaetota bacterium]